MKKQIISTACLLALALTTVASPMAHAQRRAEGQTSSGGGSSVDDLMVEAYRIKNIASDPRLAGTLSILESLSKDAPYLARTLRENLDALAWYDVPVELEVLPKYKTGLSFNTDQTAFQAASEVFIAAKHLKGMVQKNAQTDLFIHELLMAEVIKNGKSANDADHARVRKMTSAILDRLSGDALNSAIIENGFSASAVADVWNYLLIEPKPGIANPGGSSTVLASKGTRYLVYKCNAEALATVHERQIDSNQEVPPGLRRMLSAAVQHPGCQLATPTMYTITREFMNEAERFISIKEAEASRMKSDAKNRGAWIGAVAGIATAYIPFVILSEIGIRKDILSGVAEFPILGRIVYYGGFPGLLVVAGGMAGGGTIGEAIGENVGEKQSNNFAAENKLAELNQALANLSKPTTVVKSFGSADREIQTLTAGLERLADLGFAHRTLVTAKAK